MDTISAFKKGMASFGKEAMVFDWDKAATLIIEHKGKHVSAGLHDDWEYTGGEILKDGRMIPQEDTYTYLASTWATPEINIDGIIYECYKMESEVPEWDSDTYWPEEARNKLISKLDN